MKYERDTDNAVAKFLNCMQWLLSVFISLFCKYLQLAYLRLLYGAIRIACNAVEKGGIVVDECS